MSSDVRYKKRLAVLSVVLLLIAACVVVRLVFLQVLDTASYRARARDQHENNVRIEGRRGTLWERNGRELAVSIDTKSVYVHPNLLPTAAERERVAAGVSSVLRTARSEIRNLIERNAGKKFVFLKRRLSPREARAIQDLELPGTGLMSDTRRFYPRGPFAAHVLGFVDVDGKGQAGIEKALDDVVRGEPTHFISLVDGRQRPLLLRATATGRPGCDVVLTLDEYIQHLVDREMDRAMQETGAKAGTMIVMDPHTGEILALANRPAFDPNWPAAVPGRNRENIALSYGYEPGSTFKVVTAAAAIEEKRARSTDVFDCGRGSITLYGRRIGDHHPHGALSLSQVIAKSSNVGIIRVGQRIPERTFCEYVRRFGFGHKTGIGLPSEAPGVLQVPGGGTWSGLSQAMMSMGQSIVVTPLQMLLAVSAMADGGRRRAPRIVKSITPPNGSSEEVEVERPVRVISAETARTLVRMMEEVVVDGTGKAAAIPGYRVAGKTGTAQKVVGGVYSHTAHVSSFVGFAPSTNPIVAAIVVIDEPVGDYYGGDVAAPTFARVIGPTLSYLRVPPTEAIATPPPTRSEILRARAAREARSKARVLRAALASTHSEDLTPKRPFPAPWPSKRRSQAGVVPDLYGCNLRDALTALARTGCRARANGSGFVVEQTPIAGALLAAGEVCTLILAPDPPADDAAEQGL